MYYEEFIPQETLTTGRRQVTVSDLDAFLKLTGLENPIFLSNDGAAAAGHSGRIVPAPFQISIAMGLAQQAGLFDHVVAVLEFDVMKFHRSVHPGDTLMLKAVTLQKRETSRSERGLVVLEYRLLNQQEETVMSCRATYLMRRRPFPEIDLSHG